MDIINSMNFLFMLKKIIRREKNQLEKDVYRLLNRCKQNQGIMHYPLQYV